MLCLPRWIRLWAKTAKRLPRRHPWDHWKGSGESTKRSAGVGRLSGTRSPRGGRGLRGSSATLERDRACELHGERALGLVVVPREFQGALRLGVLAGATLDRRSATHCGLRLVFVGTSVRRRHNEVDLAPGADNRARSFPRGTGLHRRVSYALAGDLARPDQRALACSRGRNGSNVAGHLDARRAGVGSEECDRLRLRGECEPTPCCCCSDGDR